MNPRPLSREREVRGEIMKTDVFVKLFARPADQSPDQLQVDLDACFDLFRNFASRYSRFLSSSELSQFNQSSEYRASQEFFDLLVTAQEYWSITAGVFNPTIITALERSGYDNSEVDQNPFEKPSLKETILPLSALHFDHNTLTIRKPLNLRIDLGGIGKGYCVDTVARFLESRGYEHFLVDAGGDMYAAGRNLDTDMPWIIDIENPVHPEHSLLSVRLQDQSIATSGRNRRHWQRQSEPRHHLIHPDTARSEYSRLLTVTVVSTTATDADVWAKTLFLLGEKDGILKAETEHIPACFAFDDETFHINSFLEPYVIPS